MPTNERTFWIAAGRSGRGVLEHVRFPAFGAFCDIRFVALDDRSTREFAREAERWLGGFEARFSRFRPDSLISRINASAGRDWVPLDADAQRIFALADQVHVLTRGLIDPTVLPLVRLWRHGSGPARRPGPDEIRAAAAKVGWARVRREADRVYLPEEGMGLDFGCFGRDFATDRVLEVARSHGFRHVMVDLGRVSRAIGRPPDAAAWSVGVEDPDRTGAMCMRLAISGVAVAASGYRGSGDAPGGAPWSDIIDPRSGHPVDNGCSAAVVVAGSCLEAGLLAAMLFIRGPEDGLRMLSGFSGAEGFLFCGDRTLETPGFARFAS